MSALTFDKSELGNLEYSLQREMLSTDRIGGYMSTTIVCCNTRRYHGLMVAPIDDSCRTYVLLSSLDETVVQHDQTFNLALHRFKGVYEPRGHKYITDFEYTPTPTITYRVGGVILKKEMLWIHKRTQLMIRYTLVDAHSETRLRLRPFLAFRDKHALTHANMEADGHSYPAVNGVKCRLYNSFPWLYLQTSKPGTEFVPAPDWYYGFEYQQELARGYEGYEDLLTTGYFEAELKKGESIIFSASLDEMGSTKTIEEVFAASIARRTHKIDFISCLEHSARQFLIRRPGDRTEVVSGYPWHGVSGRQTFISLPGITLEQGHKEDCIDALDTLVREMRDGMFTGSASAEVAADAPSGFLDPPAARTRSGGQGDMGELRPGHERHTGELPAGNRRPRGAARQRADMGFIGRGAPDVDEFNDRRTPRNPAQRLSGRSERLVVQRRMLCARTGRQIRGQDGQGLRQGVGLASGSHTGVVHRTVPPAGGLFGRLRGRQRSRQIDAPQHDRRLRTELQDARRDDATGGDPHGAPAPAHPEGTADAVAPNPLYRGSQEGMPAERDFAAKNGSVWPWLLPFYIKACFDIDGDAFLPQAEEALENFDEDIQRYGIGSICELYDADPPYASRGAISQAWSVGAALDIHRMIRERSKGDSQGPKAAKKSGRTNGPKEKKPAKTKPAAKSAGKTVKAAAKSPTAAKAPKAAAKKAAPKAAAGKAAKK